MTILALLLLAQPFQVHGLADVYYALDPGASSNFLPGTGTTAPRANELDLNAAAIDLSLEPKPVGFHLTLAFGSGVDVLHAVEPAAFRNVYQASVSWAPIEKLTLDAGIDPSHIGFESFFSKDNWNYTRGWMGEFSPYYQAGVKVTYLFDARWSAQVHFLNGWQVIRDDNRAKAVGTQLAFAGEKLSFSINTFAGPELPRDDSHWRLFGDLVAQYRWTGALQIGACLDAGRQDLPQGSATWQAAALFARYGFGERLALAGRVELFGDGDGLITGTPRTLSGETLTLEARPVDHLILKLEGRHDFPTGSLAIASAVASF